MCPVPSSPSPLLPSHYMPLNALEFAIHAVDLFIALVFPCFVTVPDVRRAVRHLREAELLWWEEARHRWEVEMSTRFRRSCRASCLSSMQREDMSNLSKRVRRKLRLIFLFSF
jgi:hypothetical protein